MIRLILSAFSAFVFFVVSHFLIFHYFEPRHRVNCLLVNALFGLAAVFFIYLKLPEEKILVSRLGLKNSRILAALPLLVGAIFYVLLFVGYLEFYFTADRSITFRMMRIADERPGQSITAGEMLAAYDTQGIIVRRMEDLVYGGYFNKDGEIYSLTTKGAVTLAVYRFTLDYLHMGKF